MKNWTIGKRIIFGGGALSALLVVVGSVGWYCLAEIRGEAVRLKNDVMPGVVNAGAVTINQGENFVRTMLLGRATTDEEKKTLTAQVEELIAKNNKTFAAYETAISSSAERELFAQMITHRDANRKARAAYLKIAAADADEGGKFLRSDLVPAYNAYSAATRALFDYNAKDGEMLSLTIDASARKASYIIVATSLAALVLAGAFGWFIIRGTNQALSVITDQIGAGAEETADAASQVQTASQALAEGSTEQAASLEETSASLEEISSMTKRNAESAGSAKDLSSQTRRAAESGASSMTEMKQAMDAIKTSSSNIAKIVKTIDEIAFQTNILALNAAVEAARAGEAGAGFAVVADEVRSLAQRSAQSAKETAEKIEESVSRSEHGVRISMQVAENFTEIVTKARKVDELVAEIATASNEQTQGISQVTTAVSQMDKVTQTNAASAEESASASEELSAQAQSMRDSVRALRALVGGGGRGTPQVISPPSPSWQKPSVTSKPARLKTPALAKNPLPEAVVQRGQGAVSEFTNKDEEQEHDRFFN